MWKDLFYAGHEPLVRTLVIAVVAYPAMLFLVRVSGHRTLSKMNAFDMIVTIALGSTLASVITSESLALAQGLLAFFLLVFMQYGITFMVRRSSTIEHHVNGEPTLLFHRGRFLHRALDEARLTESNVLAAMRSTGASTTDDVESVVLETNGTISVVRSHTGGGGAAPAPDDAVSTLRAVPRGQASTRSGDPGSYGRPATR